MRRRSLPAAGCGPGRRPCPGGGAGGRQAEGWLLLAEGERIQRHPLLVPLDHRREDPEGRRLHHRRGSKALVIPLAPLALLLLLAGPAGAATVLSVGDGDTMRVVDGSKRLTIRLACIDVPETAQRPYGDASSQRLQELAPVGSGGASVQQKASISIRILRLPGSPRASLVASHHNSTL